MLGKGLKRKLEPEEEEEHGVKKMASAQDVSCYLLQRQTVLNLSLLKLHSRTGQTDPGLARQVLITNTLRHIQDELRGEAVLPQPAGGAVSLRERPEDYGVETQSEGSLEDNRYLFLSSSVIKDSFTSALAEIEDLCPTVGFTTSISAPDHSGLDITSSVDSVNSDEQTRVDSESFRSQASDSTHSLFGHAPSLLADFSLDDFLFTEIDNFLFDNAPCSSPSGASKVVSMVTDDLVKTLVGYGNSGTSQSALPMNQTFKLDLNELDHIMEVLVGS